VRKNRGRGDDQLVSILRPRQQVRQLGDIEGDPARLIACEQIGGPPPSGLGPEIHVSQARPLLSRTMKQLRLCSSMPKVRGSGEAHWSFRNDGR
jgi:hypothetical protein